MWWSRFGPPSPWKLSDLYCSTASFKTGKLLLWYPSISSNCNPQICSCTYFCHTFWGNKLPSMWERDLQSYPRWLPCLEPSLLVLGLTVSIPFLFWRVRFSYLFVRPSICGWWKLLKTPDWCKPEQNKHGWRNVTPVKSTLFLLERAWTLLLAD
jgi:hypothetical protein